MTRHRLPPRGACTESPSSARHAVCPTDVNPGIDVVVAVAPGQLLSTRGVSRVVRLTVTKNRVGPTGCVNAVIRRPGGVLVDVADESRVGEPSISADSFTTD